MPGSDSRDVSPVLPGGGLRSSGGENWGKSESDVAWSTERSQRKVPVPVASTVGLPLFRKFAIAKK